MAATAARLPFTPNMLARVTASLRDQLLDVMLGSITTQTWLDRYDLAVERNRGEALPNLDRDLVLLYPPQVG